MALFLCTGCTACRDAMEGKERRMSMDGRADVCSCNICTSTIHGGRIPQRAMDGGAVIFVRLKYSHHRGHGGHRENFFILFWAKHKQ